MFPIMNQKGETIAFGGRLLGDGKPKYLNSPETPLFACAKFGLPQARARRSVTRIRRSSSKVIWTSWRWPSTDRQRGGDARYGDHGNARAKAAASGRSHRLLLRRRRAGRAARGRWKNSLEALPEQKSVGFVFLPEAGRDPDSFVRNQGTESFERLIAQAMPLSEFLCANWRRIAITTSAEGRAKIGGRGQALAWLLANASFAATVG